MSTSDDIWILGIHMTKFGKHSDKDIVDLGSEAIFGALADAGVTMADIGILAAGNLMGRGGIGQQIQKQVGQTGIPVYNVSNACATGATALRTAIMAVKAGECDMGLAVGVEKLAGVGLLGGGSQRRRRRRVDAARVASARSPRSTAASAPRPCRACSPRSAWSTATSTAASTSTSFAQISEKNHGHSTLNPLAAYKKAMTLEQIMNDVMIAYPNTRPDVLGQLRRRRRGGGHQRREAQDALARAAAPRGQGVGLDPHERPVAGGLPGAARRQHAHPHRPPSRRTSRPASARTTSTSSSCTTASPRPNSCTTTT